MFFYTLFTERSTFSNWNEQLMLMKYLLMIISNFLFYVILFYDSNKQYKWSTTVAQLFVVILIQALVK